MIVKGEENESSKTKSKRKGSEESIEKDVEYEENNTIKITISDDEENNRIKITDSDNEEYNRDEADDKQKKNKNKGKRSGSCFSQIHGSLGVFDT